MNNLTALVNSLVGKLFFGIIILFGILQLFTGIVGNVLATTEPPLIIVVETDKFGGASCDSCFEILTNPALTYNYDVDWNNDGDYDDIGESGNTGDTLHNFGTAGIYTIRISGDFPQLYFEGGGDVRKIIELKQWGAIVRSSMSKAFMNARFLINSATDAPNLSNVTNMGFMFSEAEEFNGDLSGWDVSNVTNMGYMFNRAYDFNGDLSGWDVSNVENMAYMFNVARNFNGDVSGWNVSNVTNMKQTFNAAQSFNRDLSGRDITSVTDMTYMLDDTAMSNENYDLLLDGWAQQSVQAGVPFRINANYCAGLVSKNTLTTTHGWSIIDSGIDPDCQEICDDGFDNNEDGLVDNFDPDCPFEFICDDGLDNDGDGLIDSNDPDCTIEMSCNDGLDNDGDGDFDCDDTDCDQNLLCSGGGSTDDFVTTRKTDNDGESCDSCVYIGVGDSLTNPDYYTSYNYDVDWNNDGIFDSIGNTGEVTHDYGTSGIYTIRIRGDFPYFGMWKFFDIYTQDDDASKLLDVNQWGSNERQSFEGSFRGTNNLTTISATDTPDLSTVTNMQSMFGGSSINNLNISGWNVSTVEDMSYMFRNAINFNGDISGWDVSTVTNMRDMFRSAFTFNSNIGGWDVSNVTNMRNMFENTPSFNRNIGGWDITSVTNDFGDFLSPHNGNGMSSQNYDLLLNGWGTQDVQQGLQFNFSGGQYCDGQVGRKHLIEVHGWNITDSGTTPNCVILIEECTDSIDNDQDGNIDCADTDCMGIDPICEANEQTCDDGFDNDGDGDIDCADSNCWGSQGPGGFICQQLEFTCNDTIDNDGDGYIDCDDSDCANDVSCQGVNQSPTVEITSPVNNSSFPEPASITLEATASDPDGNNTITQVEFFEGNTSLGIDGSSPYQFLFTDVQEGSYDLTAIVTDNQGATASSSVVSVTVTSGGGGNDPEICDDGVDNDTDGFVDCFDTDCDQDPACQGPMTETSCTDGIDNDGDQDIDCADTDCSSDPACSGPTTENICDDGLDNDTDGVFDCADIDCDGVGTCEYGNEISCDDGIDNDGDTFIDCADVSCAQDSACIESICDDGLDNDGDQVIDCLDLDCNGVGTCEFNAEVSCDDGIDNDGDTFIDCNDTDCSNDVACTGPATEALCDDGIDNDGDTFFDCNDSDCQDSPACSELICDDGIDNDNDNDSDCLDQDCDAQDAGGYFCENSFEITCSDGVDSNNDGMITPDEYADNDGDGFANCADSNCMGTDPICEPVEVSCGDLFDNDADGLIDCDDSDCSADPLCTGGGFSCGNVTSIPTSECEALVDIYYEMGGTQWRTKYLNGDSGFDGWILSDDPSNWYGVTVTNGNVTGLDFDGGLQVACPVGSNGDFAGLTGNLPDSFGNLNLLENLSFSYNSYINELSFDEIVQPLETLCLRNGSISTVQGLSNFNAINLTDFDITDNSIYTLDPIANWNTPSLNIFQAGVNNFYDLNALSTWNTSSLTQALFDFNNISDVSIFANWTNLDVLSFGWNDYVGAVPSYLTMIGEQNALVVNGTNQICGEVPTGVFPDDYPPQDGDDSALCGLGVYCNSNADCGSNNCSGNTCSPGNGGGGNGGGNTPPSSETICGDGIDNDQDGNSDCADSDCNGIGGCEYATELSCNDGIDNDGDNQIDCSDANCAGASSCQPTPPSSETSCTDGIDNDQDGQTDCADQDCNQYQICVGSPGGGSASLTIVKNVINDHGGVTSGGSFSFDVDDAHTGGNTVASTLGGGTVQITTSQTYHIFEEIEPGYTFTETTCRRKSDGMQVYQGNSNSSENYVNNNRQHVAHFAIELGEEYFCTVTNDDIDQSTGGGNTNPEICDDQIDNDGDQTIDCADVDCSGASNCMQQPTSATITINKTVINNNGGALDGGDFDFEIDDAHTGGNTVVSISGGDTGDVSVGGTYHIFEDIVSDYEYVSTTCTRDSDGVQVYQGTSSSSENYVDGVRQHVAHFAVVLGESYTCTVVNDDIAQAAPTVCAGGTYWTGSSCVSCEANNYCPGGEEDFAVQTACPNGMLSIGSSSSQSACYTPSVCGDSVCNILAGENDAICPADCTSGDDDGDGVNDIIEIGGPNDGDANFDGLADAEQQNVATIPTVTAGVVSSIDISDSSSCSTIDYIANVSVSTVANDNLYDFPFGLHAINFACDSVDVKIWYHGVSDVSGYTYRKYSNVLGWYTLPVTTGVQNGVGFVSFTLVDGGVGDADGTVNGMITDPGGLGEEVVITPTVSNGNSGGKSSSIECWPDCPGVPVYYNFTPKLAGNYTKTEKKRYKITPKWKRTMSAKEAEHYLRIRIEGATLMDAYISPGSNTALILKYILERLVGKSSTEQVLFIETIIGKLSGYDEKMLHKIGIDKSVVIKTLEESLMDQQKSGYDISVNGDYYMFNWSGEKQIKRATFHWGDGITSGCEWDQCLSFSRVASDITRSEIPVAISYTLGESEWTSIKIPF